MKDTIAEGENSLIRPFEWLTNAASLKSLITRAVEYASEEEKEGESKEQPKQLSALNVGSGSSVVGEYMVEALGFSLVVNLDKDEETLEQMQERWLQRCQNKETNISNQQRAFVAPERLVFCSHDFSEHPFPYPSNQFDLILDKSTLDCTLCSDKAAACLLVQVYRCLKVGGCYLLISFHEYDFLAPLLKTLPGAHWQVLHSTMERQVEDLGIINQLNTDHGKDEKPEAPDGGDHAVEPNPSEQEKPPLNVFMVRKERVQNSKLSYDPHVLDLNAVIAHVHECNDAWFQQHQPLLTRQREQALREAFENPLALEAAYLVLFTDAEREHLTYEHFLEDWEAYLEQRKTIPRDFVSCDEAIRFLQEMQ